MQGNVGDVLHCEELLRSTLHCDDKDKLREKLAQLRREYLKTAQKLHRAERLEAIRKHVKANVLQHQAGRDQRESEGTSKPSTAPSSPLLDTSPADSTISSHVTRNLRCHDASRGSTASPALRLRTRRSRLRWQRRSADESEEGGRSAVGAEEAARFGNESQASPPESGSPSLLLSHWNTQDKEGTQDVDKDTKETEHAEKGLSEGKHDEDTKLCDGRQTGQSIAEKQEEMTGAEVKSKGLLESCTLVEGLLFPAEYYVRTTRRMTLSQSQPDMRAIILSQLSSGRRPRRGRGRHADTQVRQSSAELSSKHSGPTSISETPTGAFSAPLVGSACPGRGRRRRRGRGRGNNLVQGRTPASLGASLPGTGSPKPQLNSEQQATPPETPGSQRVFLKSSQTATPTPTHSGAQNWHSLLLPSPRPASTPSLPVHSPLVSNLVNFELHQDFHLPDDQFALLKLNKLRQTAAVESGVEPFASAPCTAPVGVLRRSGTPATPLVLPLSFTPTAGESPPSRNADRDLAGTSCLDRELSFQEQTDDPRQEAPRTCVCPLEGATPELQSLNLSPEEVKKEHSVHSQLRLSPPGATAPLHPPSSSPMLPSLGVTPLATVAALPHTSDAPSLTLPSPHSPSTQALSPPTLSPHPKAEGAAPHTAASVPGAQKTAAEDPRRCTLKAPAGGRLVDACCLLDTDGRLCVAAAGKWAVCLWSRDAGSCAWTPRHTWTFSEPVISVFPVSDACGLVCVTLGQLEIRQVRVLSCRGLQSTLLCDGGLQAAVAVSGSRVVASRRSATGSTLEALNLSDDGSASSRRPLGSPGVCVGALAPVDGLPDALIGTNEGGHLFVWNVKSGHLLQRMDLSDTLSHTSCLRGFSYGGVLLVLVQHSSLSITQQEESKNRHGKFHKEGEEKKSSLFSLVAVNPLNAKSVPAARLDPPTSWSGRLCEADAGSAAVVGLSQSGRVCVWELLGPPWGAVTVASPESEGWQLARWAEDGATLVTGHHSGDVTLHFDLVARDGFT
ncbi:partner and localizer of BRCA2 isoform X2 [Dunckerocampus dactyliophorus]|uniref:partner and localizer of BRCA2 isoform X2 n=1 Tax=Dunckerocampus dactyliophorus TaxID=161453 RepID=UPI0024051C9D|nr:partner and localizer of BRCA2 isoform X2 [Dunckerocampus dactyliophorus]